MRTYIQNSPQAAARIVALAVVADGDIGQPELDLLERLGVHQQLGLDRPAFHDVLDTFCEDLLYELPVEMVRRLPCRRPNPDQADGRNR